MRHVLMNDADAALLGEAMASAASVTVSIAAEQSGICSRMLRVNCVDVSVSCGSTSERAGTKRTSSNVSPSAMVSIDHLGMLNSLKYERANK